MQKTLGVLSACLLVAGCMGTKHISPNITNQGTLPKEDVQFPALDKAWQKGGQFANSENLTKIRPGVTKDELYHLIGRPHFSEAQKAREWDYILKFYVGDEVKVCQYKVIFDKDFKGQSFYWKPTDCAQFVQGPPVSDVPTSVISVVPIYQERINVSADALFAFDKFKADDMLPQGRRDLDALAATLRAVGAQGRVQAIITGHTDRLGDDMYNMNLSLLRAQTVRTYLLNQGAGGAELIATGAGESQPVVACGTDLPRNETISCLQPNRRVTVDVSVFAP